MTVEQDRAALPLNGLAFHTHEQGRREWLQASFEITRSLLSATGEEPLEVVARVVNQIVDADLTLVMLPVLDGDSMMIEVAVGEGTEHLIGFVFPSEGSVTGEAIRSGQAVLAADLAERSGGNPVQDAMPEIVVGPLMVVPLFGDRGARGALGIARRRGGQAFNSEDLELATSFANHAALALELAAVRAYQQRMILLEDRHRIAAELHDHVLQRLFASGMSMQAMATSVGAPYAERLEQLIGDTDETIGRIRAVIHDLNDLGPGLFSET
ncbi:GAF domain-containing protein [Sporichthya sp.]|uniref:GAF domain-containing protein n=1 Tax=Sporichthya sp. TaxID=65475 RepID=UPI001827140D|nr:GAF domain-containing protein [Sporichthya sp.]MBA3742093.1 GAF domain-containing protein [Sporichthya sp.]